VVFREPGLDTDWLDELAIATYLGSKRDNPVSLSRWST
jgi:hypothetical protein